MLRLRMRVRAGRRYWAIRRAMEGGKEMMHPGRRTMTFDGVEYAVGSKFKVVRTGGYLIGWKHDSLGAIGWSQRLAVGEVIVCDGAGFGFGSDPGYGIEFQNDEVGRACFHPTVGGSFNYRPQPGYLEPVNEEEEAA